MADPNERLAKALAEATAALGSHERRLVAERLVEGLKLGEIVGWHDLCRGRLYLMEDGTTYCFKCDQVVEEL